MLIKEYRIPLPLTVEEYRVAQLYMIAKKSKEETHGQGSGVEILKNEPYNESSGDGSGSGNGSASGGGGSGQYTKKIYHVGYHLPGWLKALLPKSALIVEECAWNCYPYTKTRYTCPFVERFFIEIETKYFDDDGHQENVFNLNNDELKSRIVDVIDIVKDQITTSDYKKEEDPRFYVSQVTQRGPLSDNWVEEHWLAQSNGNRDADEGGERDADADADSNDDKDKHKSMPKLTIMCAYKLCRVEFQYWGMQSNIEKFIHDYALRKTMVKAHKQAWTWQDEWVNLTMADIRQLEKETQEYLRKRMANNGGNGGNDGNEGIDETQPNTGSGTVSTGLDGNGSGNN